MNRHQYYQIIENSADYEVLRKVNNMIADGWLPCGGLAYTGSRYAQAMWKPPFPEEIKIVMDNFKDKKAIEK
jgi:hypothetical protein